MTVWIFDLEHSAIDVNLFHVAAYTFEGACFRLRRHLESQLGRTRRLDQSIYELLAELEKYENGDHGQVDYYDSNDVGVVYNVSFALD